MVEVKRGEQILKGKLHEDEKGNWGVVDGTITQPVPGHPDHTMTITVEGGQMIFAEALDLQGNSVAFVKSSDDGGFVHFDSYGEYLETIIDSPITGESYSISDYQVEIIDHAYNNLIDPLDSTFDVSQYMNQGFIESHDYDHVAQDYFDQFNESDYVTHTIDEVNYNFRIQVDPTTNDQQLITDYQGDYLSMSDQERNELDLKLLGSLADISDQEIEFALELMRESQQSEQGLPDQIPESMMEQIGEYTFQGLKGAALDASSTIMNSLEVTTTTTKITGSLLMTNSVTLVDEGTTILLKESASTKMVSKVTTTISNSKPLALLGKALPYLATSVEILSKSARAVASDELTTDQKTVVIKEAIVSGLAGLAAGLAVGGWVAGATVSAPIWVPLAVGASAGAVIGMATKWYFDARMEEENIDFE